jgi:hypothetical protein
MPITSSHSFYFRNYGIEARAVELGSSGTNKLGATINLITPDDFLHPLVFFVDDVEYARALAEAINAVGRKFFLGEAQEATGKPLEEKAA